MATHVYVCPVHGEFEVRLLAPGAPPPETCRCVKPVKGVTRCGQEGICGRLAPWRPSAPAIHFGESWGPRA